MTAPTQWIISSLSGETFKFETSGTSSLEELRRFIHTCTTIPCEDQVIIVNDSIVIDNAAFRRIQATAAKDVYANLIKKITDLHLRIKNRLTTGRYYEFSIDFNGVLHHKEGYAGVQEPWLRKLTFSHQALSLIAKMTDGLFSKLPDHHELSDQNAACQVELLLDGVVKVMHREHQGDWLARLQEWEVFTRSALAMRFANQRPAAGAPATNRTIGAISRPVISGNAQKSCKVENGQFEIQGYVIGDHSTHACVMMALGPWDSFVFLQSYLSDIDGVTLEELKDITKHKNFSFRQGSERLEGAFLAFRSGETMEKLVRFAERNPEILPFRIARAFRKDS